MKKLLIIMILSTAFITCNINKTKAVQINSNEIRLTLNIDNHTSYCILLVRNDRGFFQIQTAFNRYTRTYIQTGEEKRNVRNALFTVRDRDPELEIIPLGHPLFI